MFVVGMCIVVYGESEWCLCECVSECVSGATAAGSSSIIRRNIRVKSDLIGVLECA
jgi:hypothetical protein